MKKTLLLARAFPPKVGGIERFMAEIYGRAAVQGLPLKVLAMKAAGASAFDANAPFDVVRCQAPPIVGERFRAALIPMFARAAREIRRFGPAAIHCDQFDSAVAARALKPIFGLPYLLFAYGMEVTDEKSLALRRSVFVNASTVIAITKHMRSLLIDEIGVDPERVHIVYPGVDTERFSPRPRPAALAETLGLSGRRVIMTVARLSPAERYKGHDTVIRALPSVLSRVPNAAYLIVGDGPDRARLSALAHSTGVGDRVVFAGRVPDEALPDYFALCDVFVMVSRRSETKSGAYRGEGFGIVFLEAAASGKPTVAGNEPGMAEAIQHGETGLLVDPARADDVAEALLAILQDERYAADLGRRGRERAVSSFTWDRAAKEFLLVTNDVQKSAACARVGSGAKA